MSGDPLDFYDVQAMIRDARSEIRGEIDRAVSAIRDDLHEELRELQREIDSLGRVLNTRTEHLT